MRVKLQINYKSFYPGQRFDFEQRGQKDGLFGKNLKGASINYPLSPVEQNAR